MLAVRYIWRSLVTRIRANAITVLAVTLFVVGVSFGFSFYASLKTMLVETAPPENVIVLSKGAATEAGSKLSLETANKVVLLEGIQKLGDAPLAVRELVTRVQLAHTGFAPIRGIDELSPKVHRITLVQGQLPDPDKLDIILGKRIARSHPELAIGTEFFLPAGPSKVTGIFEANGGPLEDEIWTPRRALEAHAKTKISSSMTLTADGAGRVQALIDKLNDSKDLNAEAMRVSTFREGGAGFETLARIVFILLLLLSVVATSAIATTMSAAATARLPELATLAAIGLRRSFLARLVVLESVVLATFGAALGAVLTTLISHKVGVIKLGGNPVDLTTSLGIPLIGLAIGVCVGVVGGIVPALMVRRLSIIDAIR